MTIAPATPAGHRKLRHHQEMSVASRLLRAVLTSAPAMAAKKPLKDVLWTVRGRGLSNPPLPRNVRSVLFLCQGNICRSPFAALRLAQLLAAQGAAITSTSAGLSTTQADRSPREACEAAAAFGLSLEQHRPLQLTPALVGASDVIVVMEAAQLQRVRALYPNAADRVWLLSLLDGERGYARFHISDPFGRSRATFDHCYQRIDRALHALIPVLAGAAGDRAPGGRAR